MLYKHAVSPELLDLIKLFMQRPLFREFNLVGGTALALQMGHRISIDIDMFGSFELEETDISKELRALGNLQILKKSKNILIYSLNGIKVDFVNYQYPNLETPIVEEHIRMLSLADIAAMKLNAISGRGSRKDFVDLYFLLNLFPLHRLLEFYKSKFSDGSEFLVLKSLVYFEDAEKEEMPRMIIPVKWEEIKSKIIVETNNLF